LAQTLLQQAEKRPHGMLIAAKIHATPEELRLCADDLMNRLQSGIIVLATALEHTCQFIVRVSDDLISQGFKAGDIVKKIAPMIEGSGGGKPNSAQAGGKAPQNIEKALAYIREII